MTDDGPSGAVQRLGSLADKHADKVRFLFVGAWNTLFSVGVLWLLDRFIPYDRSSFLQKELIFFTNWAIGVTHNFFTFKLLVFRTKGNWVREYGKMYVTYAATFVVQSLMMQAISAYFGLSVFWATVPTIFVVMVLSYLGHKHFTFRRPEETFEPDAEGP